MGFITNHGNISGNGMITWVPIVPTLSSFLENNPVLSTSQPIGSTYMIAPPSTDSPNGFTYSSSNSSIARVSGETITMTGVGGPVTITARQITGGYYLSASTSLSFSVVSAPPTIDSLLINNSSLASSQMIGTTYLIKDPSSNSKGSFTYTSGNTTVASISNKTITMNVTGTAVITATQSANGGYLSGNTTLSINVYQNYTTPYIDSLTVNNPALAYGLTQTTYTIVDPQSSSTGAFTYTSSNTAIATVSGKVITMTGVGGFTTITGTQAASGYNLSTTTTLVISYGLARNIYSWGANTYRESNGGSYPTIMSSLNNKNIVSIDSGPYHAIAVDSSGIVYTWGANWSGQIGDGSMNLKNYTTPYLVNGPGTSTVITGTDFKIIAVAAGSSGINSSTNLAAGSPNYNGQGTSYALGNNGKVYAWGGNQGGQVGNGSNGNYSTVLVPTEVSTVDTPMENAFVTNIYASIQSGNGQYSTVYALDSSGILYAWGNNTYASIGNPTSPLVNSYPIMISFPSPTPVISKIVISKNNGNNVHAIDTSGNCWVWGYNHGGTIGDVSSSTVISNGTTPYPINISSNNSASLLYNKFITQVIGIDGNGTVFVDANNHMYSTYNNQSIQLMTNIISSPVSSLAQNGGVFIVSNEENVYYLPSAAVNVSNSDNIVTVNAAYPNWPSSLLYHCFTYGYVDGYALVSTAFPSIQLGNGNYLQVNDTILSATANTFTVEAWIYPTSFANTSGLSLSNFSVPSLVGDMSSNDNPNGWSFGPDIHGKLVFYNNSETPNTVVSNATISLNQWTHIAISCNNTQAYYYINGVQDASMNIYSRVSTNGVTTIGQYNSSYYFTGYANNIRISKVARYNGNFNIPGYPFDSELNTLFLLGNHGSQNVDVTNKNTITTGGSPTPFIGYTSPFY